MIRIAQMHEAPLTGEKRYLVERSWPKGLHRTESKLSGWLKDAAPSPALWKWFHHDFEKADEFKRRYFRELSGKPGVGTLLEALREGDVALVVSGHPRQSHARWLREYVRARATADRPRHVHHKLEKTPNRGVQPPPEKAFAHRRKLLGQALKKVRFHV